MEGGSYIDNFRLELGSQPVKGLCIVRANVRVGATLIRCLAVTTQPVTRRKLMSCYAMPVKRLSS